MLSLILCGGLLVAAIIVGTVIMVGEFRERALSNSERELENTVLLLTRHFDQQFEDTEIIATDVISRMQFSEIASPETFRIWMSSHDAHLILKSKVSVLSYIGDVGIFDVRRQADQLVANLAAAGRQHRRPGLFQEFQVGPGIENRGAPNRLATTMTGNWTTVIAHRLSGPNGVFLGVMARRIDPVQFRTILRIASRLETARRFPCSIAMERCWRAIPMSIR